MSNSVDQHMGLFYRRLFPYKSIFHWLNHAPTPEDNFTKREIAFNLPGDVMLRYQSFLDADEFKAQVCKLVPTRFEIGPVYTSRPRDRKTARPGSFNPVARELVFDIDMTDYDPIRTCCSDAQICRKCWKFIAAAVKVLDEAIRQQFGYEHLLWVYSGRRGIHLWISDPEAMALTDEQRKAIVGWLSVVQKDESKRPNIRFGSHPLPASLAPALNELAVMFTEIILEDQDCFGSEKGYEALLRLIPDARIVDALREEWSGANIDSVEKWKNFKAQIKTHKKDSATRAHLTAAMEDIILQYTYPRLDENVSKKRNHLLKAPFCVHPKTGRVCVPVDPKRINEFDPERVPTLSQLIDELDADTNMETEHHSDWERTSLKEYVNMLDAHNQRIMNEARNTRRGTADLSW
uniref:DNA primase n=1 Tax=Mycena chlorophos TaxID=658473 RepID=A0ABQ0M6F3_MYCCL|nr:DNA primase small subunit [Mycena chlorophos]